MKAPTYGLDSSHANDERYLDVVRQLADWVEEYGGLLRPLIDAYGESVERIGRDRRCSYLEYLVESLVLGVLWRARGGEALEPNERRRGLVTEIVRERRNNGIARRDSTTADLVTIGGKVKRGRLDPTLKEISLLLDWMFATGEYDDEHRRLEGYHAFLSATPPATRHEILRLIVAFAVRFEAIADHLLGRFTRGVERFIDVELTSRHRREDTVQCSRRRTEYHLNMVGAELLNRAWRKGFLARRRRVVVLPGCARLQANNHCRARLEATKLKCTHCSQDCIVSTTTRLAERFEAATIVINHGSDFTRYLDEQKEAGQDLGVIGVACAPGLIGGGWRIRDNGLMAQCVLLNASACKHWQSITEPTAFDLGELTRILSRSDATENDRNRQLSSSRHVAISG